MITAGQLPPIRRRNPKTHAAHRRDVWLQIILPLLLFLTVILALCGSVIWASASGVNEVSRWASISLIWLIVPWLMIALLFLVILAGITYGVTWLMYKLPQYARQGQDFFVLAGVRVRKVADAAVEPFLRIQSITASLRALRRW